MKYSILLLFLLPLRIIAQPNSIFKITAAKERHTKFASGWIALDSGWKLKAGDDPNWARPDYDDSSWQPVKLFQDLYPLPQVPKSGIVWFRLHLIADSISKQQLVMRLYQTGASEIYLNGKLLHRLGIVNSNPDSVVYFSPNGANYSFPVKIDTEQVLAIRFAIVPQLYPLYSNLLKSNLEVWVSTIDNAGNDYIVQYNRLFANRLYVAIGVSIILFVLYPSFFLFFPAQKINLYFSLSSFFFTVFLVLQLIISNSHESTIKFLFPLTVSSVLYLSTFVYCIYKVFNIKTGKIFLLLVVACILTVPAAFITEGGPIFTSLAIFGLFDIIRIGLRSLKTNKTAASIILFCVSIDLIYWTLNLLSGLSVIPISGIDAYVPFAFLIGPLSLAIYLGYDFGRTAQSLRQKLTEVEQLSNEKQQILSDQNIVLENQVQQRTSALHQSLENLQSAQAQLIQSEKMASLGELTAGIAHEIQNPLNFVNNFSEVNKEMIDELQSELNSGNIVAAIGISNDIRQNEEKINHHGKRADAIVKGMLQHSRATSGQKEPTNINVLCDEYLRLAYHGIRAKDKDFNATLATDFDESIGNITIIPQDIGRVLLNLYNNAFYAVNEKKKLMSPGYLPTVSVRTRQINNVIEIIVSDNGVGIPQNIIDKIFHPFFTTKPTGQATGLGLSLSYDIIKAHGGEMKLESKESIGTAFTVQIPIGY